MKIRIIRHGDVRHLPPEELVKTKVYPDMPLLKEGRDRVRMLPCHIGDLQNVVGLSSTALRCMQSHEPISAITGCEPRLIPFLRPIDIINPKKVAPAIKGYLEKGIPWTKLWFEKDIGLESPHVFYERNVYALHLVLRLLSPNSDIVITASLENTWVARCFFHDLAFEPENCNLDLPFCHIETFSRS